MSLLSKINKYRDRFPGVEQKLLLLFVFVILINLGVLFWQSSRHSIRQADFGGVYTEGLVGQPQYINPLLAPANKVDMDLSEIIYSGLYKFDQNLNLIPDLAESLPEISPNGREYTIKLRENLHWHDGEQLGVDDVVFTLTVIQNQDIGSPLRLSWNRVAVEKIDELTVKISTASELSAFVANLTVGILPKHIWENVPASSFSLSRFNLEPIGSGPFSVSEIVRGRQGEIRSISLNAFKQYHENRPYIDRLVFKFYETSDGLINAYQGRDVMGIGFEPYDNTLFIAPSDRIKQFILPLPQYQAIFINRAKNPAPLESQGVRLALAQAIDKERIINEVYGGNASDAYGPILPGHLGYHEEIPGAEMNIYDIENARQLLDNLNWIMDEDLGFRKDSQGRILTLRLATTNFTPHVRIAELLKEMWQSIGIQIILNIETIAVLEEQYLRPRNYELLLFSENVGADPDPFPFWHSSQLRDPGFNFSTFSNTTADRLLVEARGNISPEDRAQKYRQFQEILVGDVPAIFLNRSVYVYNINKDVQGVNLNTIVLPSGRFFDIHKWFIKTKRVKS